MPLLHPAHARHHAASPALALSDTAPRRPSPCHNPWPHSPCHPVGTHQDHVRQHQAALHGGLQACVGHVGCRQVVAERGVARVQQVAQVRARKQRAVVAPKVRRARHLPARTSPQPRGGPGSAAAGGARLGGRADGLTRQAPRGRRACTSASAKRLVDGPDASASRITYSTSCRLPMTARNGCRWYCRSCTQRFQSYSSA